MKTTEILVYGKNPEILATVVRLINANEEWSGEGTSDEEEVIEKVQRKQYDLVMLGGAVPTVSENKIRATLGKLQPDLKIIQHFGGGSGLLKSEIKEALSRQDTAGARVNVLDNPFANQ
jgi:hypothetical protein